MSEVLRWLGFKDKTAEGKMIFCFDIDGTISAKPDIFKTIMKSLVDAGHIVYPLTGMVATGTIMDAKQFEDFRERQLLMLGLEKGKHYTDLVICVGERIEDCGAIKGKFCKEKGVSFMVEDTQIYHDAIIGASPETLCLRMPNL